MFLKIEKESQKLRNSSERVRKVETEAWEPKIIVLRELR